MSTLLSVNGMSTRNVAEVSRRPDVLTPFSLHVGKERSNVIDFTERKLIQYALRTKDVQQKLTLASLIEDYRHGLVAIAWRRGLPVPLRVTKEA
jgi:hypothetical protein